MCTKELPSYEIYRIYTDFIRTIPYNYQTNFLPITTPQTTMNTHQTLHIKNTFILAVLITILVCSISIPPIQTHAQETPKEVLILNSYHQGLSWSDSIVERA